MFATDLILNQTQSAVKFEYESAAKHSEGNTNTVSALLPKQLRRDSALLRQSRGI